MKHMLVELKQDKNYNLLKEADSMSLTKTLENLDIAYTNYFNKKSNRPVFKKKETMRFLSEFRRNLPLF